MTRTNRSHFSLTALEMGVLVVSCFLCGVFTVLLLDGLVADASVYSLVGYGFGLAGICLLVASSLYTVRRRTRAGSNAT